MARQWMRSIWKRLFHRTPDGKPASWADIQRPPNPEDMLLSNTL